MYKLAPKWKNKIIKTQTKKEVFGSFSIREKMLAY